ncbi:protein nrt1/ ptr family 5.4 [Quercus suber]|uniref:Protein nrt1/ ptr family 5.4 n=1 Tax=Quercus suber TaxID=58331 RepID=A0AAW0LXM2_QUESU
MDDLKTIPMTVWWLLPQYMIYGFSDAFTIVGLQELHGDKWLGNNLNRAHLDYYYWVLAGLSALNLCVYSIPSDILDVYNFDLSLID